MVAMLLIGRYAIGDPTACASAAAKVRHENTLKSRRSRAEGGRTASNHHGGPWLPTRETLAL